MTPKARLAAFTALAGAGALIAAFNVRSLGPALLNLPTVFSRTGLVRNIVYGPEPWQRLDIYLPAGQKTQKLPVVVFFYGGRWMDGQKEIYRFAGDAFAKRGFIVAIPITPNIPLYDFQHSPKTERRRSPGFPIMWLSMAAIRPASSLRAIGRRAHRRASHGKSRVSCA